MSDNIPLEIQMEIIQRIPDTKSLIQFRSVSKAWKSVIDSEEFVNAHALRNHHHHHLLTRKQGNHRVEYVSIVDDDTFPCQKHNVNIPNLVNKFSQGSKVVCSCHGLFCVYQDKTSTAIIRNPSLRKIVATEVPNVLRENYYRTIVGFGVCPRNLDPKLVKITYVIDWRKLEDVNTSTHVEVFTLSSGGTWRSPLSSNLPHKSIGFRSPQAVVDGFIYWSGLERINYMDARTRNRYLIMSFNLTTEEFTKVNLPDCLALGPDADLSVCNLRQSLAVLDFDICDPRDFCGVWMVTGHGCTRSFSRLYTIYAHDALIRTTLGFRKNGTPIIELENNDREGFFNIKNELFIYEPESKNFTHIGIHGLEGVFCVHSYKETLLLLGQQ